MGVSWAAMLFFMALPSSLLFTYTPTNLPSISFNTSEPFIQTINQVYKMELDLYKTDGSIMFSTYEDLQTTDGQNISTLTTIPSCNLSGFKQLNETHIAIAAYTIHCIQILNRQDGSRKTLAGICSSSGSTDGKLGVGKLKYPRSIEMDLRNPDRLLITDRYNHALRFVDLITGELGTVISSDFKYPRGLSWVGSELLVANSHYLSRVTWHVNGSVSNVLFTGSTVSGFVEDSFAKSRFNYPYELETFRSNISLVADGSNRRLRWLDFSTQLVGVVCFNGENPCTTSSQLPGAGRSLLKVGNDLYVGMYQNICKLIGIAVDPFVDKPPILCSNPTSCLPSTQPSIEILVSAGFASGVFIAILPTAIICYFYWKKRGETRPGYVHNAVCDDDGLYRDGYSLPAEQSNRNMDKNAYDYVEKAL